MDWSRGPLLGFDTETTGVDTDEDRIVTAALVVREGDVTSLRTWLIDPGVPIPVEASNIHGITTEHAQEFGQAPPAALEEIAQAITSHMSSGAPLVAYNATFDVCILDAELRRHGVATLEQRLGRPVAPVIDPLVLDRAVDRYRRGKRRLVNLCEFYGVVDTGTLHTADADVVATLDILERMVQHHPRLLAMSLEDLHAFQHTAHQEWATNFNQWLARQGRPADVGTTWLSSAAPSGV
ncbi:exonuclease domain-containing protein [Jonesia quinghaiensis]|uniref:exonuclease domain-containing protein n=1 Tax=Jonesia quinghaiensis TaxID=262806 RepID=UPI00041DC5C5|nr:exonuclease domain-containing protein [Jonesia quinghaiensis]